MVVYKEHFNCSFYLFSVARVHTEVVQTKYVIVIDGSRCENIIR